MRPSVMLAIPLASLAILSSLHGAALAAADQPRVTVLPVGGDTKAAIQKAIAKVVVKHGYQLVPTTEFREATTRLGATVEGSEAIRTVASELSLVAVVMGKVTVVKKKRTLRIVVRDGRDGEITEEATFKGRSNRALVKVVEKTFWKRMGRSLPTKPAGMTTKPISTGDDPFATAPTPPRTTAAAPTPAPEPEPTPTARDEEPAPVVRRSAPRREAEVEEEEPSEPRTGAGPSQFELSISPKMVYRNFTYVSDPQDALSEYHTSSPAPGIAASLRGFFRMGLPRVGLMAAFEQGMPLPATTSGGLEYRTFSGDYYGSLLVGVPTRYLVADLAVGGGRQRYAFSPQDDVTDSRPRPVPNVTYDYLRAGLDLHIYTGTPFSIFAGGYYRHILGSGLISSEDWFPSAQVWGAEGNFGVSYRIFSWLDARVHGDIRMYKFRMDPDAGDAHVTDGATDMYWGGGLSLAVLLGGAK
jgi:hypothetical protein